MIQFSTKVLPLTRKKKIKDVTDPSFFHELDAILGLGRKVVKFVHWFDIYKYLQTWNGGKYAMSFEHESFYFCFQCWKQV